MVALAWSPPGVKQERGAVAVERRSGAEEAARQRYGYTDEQRRQEPDQRYPSCLTQTEWELRCAKHYGRQG